MAKANNEVELWQGCDEQGIATSAVTREEAAKGALHQAAHLWVWRKTSEDIEILLQQRAMTKRTWPGYYDISAAGHVDFEESPAIAAIREAEEEIGIVWAIEDITHLFDFRASLIDPVSGIIENEIQKIYGISISRDLDFSFSDGEVSTMLWMPVEAFTVATRQEVTNIQLVPHGEAYFAQLLAAIGG